MEFVIKLYNDKPSRLGIKYLYEYQAVKAYEEIFNRNAGDVFSLRVEIIKNKVSLRLLSEQTGERILYKELDYKLEQLKRLQAFTNTGSDIQFVHVFSKANTLMIAKPFRTARFISLSSYEIIGHGSFADTI
jgi:hypothetical protein